MQVYFGCCLIKGRERGKKKSGDRSVNGYLRLWLACLLLSACCCWQCYLCRSLGELSTHLAPQALFISVLCMMPLLQVFPFPSTLGEVTLQPLSQACLFIYSSCGKWAFHPSCRVFLPLPLSQALPILVAGCAPPFLPSPARPGLFIYSSGKDSLPTSMMLREPHPLCHVSLLLFFAYYSVSLFTPGGGQSVQAAVLIWPRIVCGSTAHHLAHLVVCVFPSCLGAGDWQRPRGPPGFSIQHEVEMLCTG
jgi:hypothetical protein